MSEYETGLKKLAELMRKGRKLNPHNVLHHEFYIAPEDDGTLACCALGAVRVGDFGQTVHDWSEAHKTKNIEDILDNIGLARAYVQDPPEDLTDDTLQDIIVCLNDIKHWSVEQIAGWLEVAKVIDGFDIMGDDEFDLGDDDDDYLDHEEY